MPVSIGFGEPMRREERRAGGVEILRVVKPAVAVGDARAGSVCIHSVPVSWCVVPRPSRSGCSDLHRLRR